MTLSALWFHTNVSPLVAARDNRRWLAAILQGVGGKLGGGDGFKVNPNTGKQVRIEPCASPLEHLIINGTENALQGAYPVFLDAVDTSVTLDPEPGSNSRIDLVICHIEDAEYSGQTYRAQFDKVTGTASATPVAPDPAAAGFTSYHVLAEVLRTSSEASTIPASAFTDTRGQTFAGTRAWVGALEGDGSATKLSLDLPTGQFEHFHLIGGTRGTLTTLQPACVRINDDNTGQYNAFRTFFTGDTAATSQGAFSRTATGAFYDLNGTRGELNIWLHDVSRTFVQIVGTARATNTGADGGNRRAFLDARYEDGPAESVQLELTGSGAFGADTRVDVYGIRRGLGAASGE